MPGWVDLIGVREGDAAAPVGEVAVFEILEYRMPPGVDEGVPDPGLHQFRGAGDGLFQNQHVQTAFRRRIEIRYGRRECESPAADDQHPGIGKFVERLQFLKSDVLFFQILKY